MSRILLAWELGTGFGHLGPFLGLAPKLLARGHELHIAAREIAGAGRVVHPEEEAPDIAGALAAMLGDATYGRNARALAGRYGGESVGTMTDRAVARIEALAAQTAERTT